MIDAIVRKGRSVRVKVNYAGLCGSDVQKIQHWRGFPHNRDKIVLGHEFVGTVEEAPFKLGLAGKSVVVCPLLPCGRCLNCREGNDNLCEKFEAIGRTRDGGFAEYVDVPEENVFILPAGMNPKLAVITDVVAVCLHAVFERRKKGKSALVIGDGAIGVTLSAVLDGLGYEVCLLAKHLSTVALLKTQKLKIKVCTSAEQIQTERFDCVYETVGRAQNKTVTDALMFVKPRGEVVCLGVFPEDHDLIFNNRLLFLKEAFLTSSVSYKQKYFKKALLFLAKNPGFDFIITNELPFSCFEEGVKLMLSKDQTVPVLKIIYNLTKIGQVL